MSVETQQVTAEQKETNEDRRAKKLHEKIKKNHKWRLSTWGKASVTIERFQQELVSMGREPLDLTLPDLTDPDVAAQLAEL